MENPQESELRQFELECWAAQIKLPTLRGEGRWDWCDADAIKPFLTPREVYQIPSTANLTALYSEFFLTVLGDVTLTTDAVDQMIRVIYTSPNPDNPKELMFHHVFSQESTLQIYKAAEPSVDAEGVVAQRDLEVRYLSAVEKFMKQWRPPPVSDEPKKGVLLEKERRAKAAAVTSEDPATALDNSTLEEIQKTLEARLAEQQVAIPAPTAETARIELDKIWQALKYDPPKKATYVARQMMSFIALISVRLCVKDFKQVRKYFQVRATKAFVGTCNPMGLAASVPVPSVDFLYQVSQNFPKGTIRQKQLLQFLVGARFAYDALGAGLDEHPASQAKCGFLDAGCLLHLSMNGLGLISLAIAASQAIGVTLPWLLNACTDSSILESSRTVLRFVKMNHLKGSRELTWQWSRVIDDNNFLSVSLRNHIILGSRMAALFMKKTQDTGIWEMVAFSSLSDEQKEIVAGWADQVLQYLKTAKAPTELTVLQQKILAHQPAVTRKVVRPVASRTSSPQPRQRSASDVSSSSSRTETGQDASREAERSTAGDEADSLEGVNFPRS
ncbi:N [Blacklegged tick rhabdovirus 1]|uniref:Nucleoprotein n=1 Tax=Blacklegged tick rhabdovirus 1 TaxID=2079605 RepID=A0A2K9YNG3_9RHAB|nr:N [Blacklegged tick rhabdovirus-1] [Blacklegged tick rhabdovirus-1]AUW34386.1 N [Blacklegged tick rhabdovirus-1] [Blacklegged tick rhabdovirus-1]